MNYSSLPYRIFPLGDAALTIEFGNCINEKINKEVMARFHQLQREPLPGMTEVVPAYSSLTIYYDVFRIKKKMQASSIYEWMRQQAEEMLRQPAPLPVSGNRIINIPVCYDQEFAMDIPYLAAIRNISREEIIALHTGKTYKVFMLGFLPGFTYMGEVDERIAMPRKAQPVNVEAGSVGIAGRQTGVYPFASPGGWQVIGRTPVKLFESDREQPVLLNAGDTVQFYPITKNDFYEMQNSAERLKNHESY